MNPILSLALCSLLCSAFAYNLDETPVYIFTHPSNKAVKPVQPHAAFPTVEPNQLIDALNAYKSQKKVVIMIPELSPEFFLNDLEHLPTFQPIEYFPIVRATQLTLEQQGERTQITVKNDLEKSFEAFGPEVKTLYVEWDGCRKDETKSQYKGRFDRMLEGLVDQQRDVLFILSGAENTKAIEQQEIKSRKARAVPAVPGDSFKYDNLLVYYTKAYEHFKKETKKPISEFKITSIKPDKAVDNKLDVVFESQSYNIAISFIEIGGNWAATNASVNNNDVYSFTPIAAPVGFSFACGKSFNIQLNGNPDVDHIQIQGLQIQPKFSGDKFDLMKFGEAYDCVGFTSPGIWAGIFVTLLLLIIMSIGITALMDIRTMDRFDDPKGKTITINTNE